MIFKLAVQEDEQGVEAAVGQMTLLVLVSLLDKDIHQ